MDKVVRIITALLVALTLVINTQEIKAYEFTDDAYFIKLRDKNLSEITLYFPENQISYLSQTESNQIVNITGNTCTGYSNDIDFTISFTAFNLGRYRQGSMYDYVYLDIEEIIDSNIPQFMDDTAVEKVMYYIEENMTFYSVSLFTFLLFMVVLLWLKH